MLRRVARLAGRDYVVHPLLSLPTGSARTTLTANLTANLVRNVWSHSVIMCGHFPEGVSTFEVSEIEPSESRGQWYVRQMLGSANISGPGWLHVLCGNLSHQIEHHLFPDLPSNRYAELSSPVRALFAAYGLRYHSAPLPVQVASAWHKVFRLSLPNGSWDRVGRARAAAQSVSGPQVPWKRVRTARAILSSLIPARSAA
ncbi:fatty acid desaturase [Nocardioides piscis]|uniref:fatty acid desaturase n=1 Tax=Nocardioides piscis TaxID=2714938 RepID=UPI001FEAA756|nr:fatty acid desaturase [Nocardioides piscis]